MAQKVKQTKTENQSKMVYQHEDKRLENINVTYIYGQVFTF